MATTASDESWPARAAALRDLDPAECEGKYDAVAEHYGEIITGIQYKAHVASARAVSKVEPNLGACVLDVGCGTGQVGDELLKLGYRNIHGVDVSAGMLKVLGEKGIYTKLIKANFGPSSPIEYADGFFDVAVSSGSFQPGHLTETCLPEMIRLVKSGGHLVICTRKTIFEEERKGMRLVTGLLELTKRGSLSRVSHEEVVYSLEKGKEIIGVVLTYQVRDRSRAT